jgi:predicted dinucleotide-binding enzyme
MRIAVIGTGSVGRTLATAVAAQNHDVVVGTRDPVVTGTRDEWTHSDLRLVAYADAASGADLVINATSGDVSIAALQSVGAEALAGTVLLDVSNPLDFSAGFPPRLFIEQDQSLRVSRRPGREVVVYDERFGDGRAWPLGSRVDNVPRR